MKSFGPWKKPIWAFEFCLGDPPRGFAGSAFWLVSWWVLPSLVHHLNSTIPSADHMSAEKLQLDRLFLFHGARFHAHGSRPGTDRNSKDEGRLPESSRRSVLYLGQLTLKPQSPRGLENFWPVALVPIFSRIVQPDHVSL